LDCKVDYIVHVVEQQRGLQGQSFKCLPQRCPEDTTECTCDSVSTGCSQSDSNDFHVYVPAMQTTKSSLCCNDVHALSNELFLVLPTLITAETACMLYHPSHVHFAIIVEGSGWGKDQTWKNPKVSRMRLLVVDYEEEYM
jgi:hypothetical protein